MNNSTDHIRAVTAGKMTCRCGDRLLITPSGMLVCESGCGRLSPLSESVPGWISLANLRRAYPERIIEPAAGRKEDFRKNTT